jgi:exopolysaccharide production protein ExoQ
LVHGSLIGMAIWLLILCDSKTSLSTFAVGAGLIVFTTFFRASRQRAVLHAVVAFTIFACVAPLFLGFGEGMISSMGRSENLSGRTELWTDVLAMGTNPIIGTGFESFWLGPRLEQLWAKYWWSPVEAHNGYIEAYLNLGWAGLCILGWMFWNGYKRIVVYLREFPEAGRLHLAYFVACIAYNLTEAALHTTNIIWLFFVLSVIAIPQSAVVREVAPLDQKPKVDAEENPWLLALQSRG